MLITNLSKIVESTYHFVYGILRNWQVGIQHSIVSFLDDEDMNRNSNDKTASLEQPLPAESCESKPDETTSVDAETADQDPSDIPGMPQTPGMNNHW